MNNQYLFDEEALRLFWEIFQLKLESEPITSIQFNDMGIPGDVHELSIMDSLLTSIKINE